MTCQPLNIDRLQLMAFSGADDDRAESNLCAIIASYAKKRRCRNNEHRKRIIRLHRVLGRCDA